MLDDPRLAPHPDRLPVRGVPRLALRAEAVGLPAVVVLRDRGRVQGRILPEPIDAVGGGLLDELGVRDAELVAGVERARLAVVARAVGLEGEPLGVDVPPLIKDFR